MVFIFFFPFNFFFWLAKVDEGSQALANTGGEPSHPRRLWAMPPCPDRERAAAPSSAFNKGKKGKKKPIKIIKLKILLKKSTLALVTSR